MPKIFSDTEEFKILQRIALNPVLGELNSEQWLAIVNLVSCEVFNHHVEWCAYVHANDIDDDGNPEFPEPTYREPSTYIRFY